jgi:hypothetical protein
MRRRFICRGARIQQPVIRPNNSCRRGVGANSPHGPGTLHPLRGIRMRATVRPPSPLSRGGMLLDPGPAPAPAPAPDVIYPAAPAPGGADRPISAPLYAAQRDPAERLPAAARAKLTRLRVEQEDAGTIGRELGERNRGLADYRRALAGRLDVVKRADRRGPSAAAKQLESQIADTTTEIEALAARIARSQAARSDLPRRLNAWLASLPDGIVIEEHRGDPAPPKLARNESPTEAVAAARAKLAELGADRHAVASAPLPSAQAKAAVRREIEGRAASPDILNTIEIGAPVRWPTELRQMQVGGVSAGNPVSGFASGQEIGTFGVFCWLHKYALIARLEAEVDELADDEHALDDAARSAAERKIAAAALDVERQIEAMITASEQQGMPIARADNADPRAVLNLSGALPGASR